MHLHMVVNYAATKHHLSLRAGANNLLATDPPLSTNVGTGTGSNNTYPGLFDVSRFLFLGVNWIL